MTDTPPPLPAPTGPELLGSMLRRERKRRGHSQVDVARRMAVHQTSYHRWETGETAPDASRYGDVAEYLGLPLQELWRLLEHGEQPTSFEMLRVEQEAQQRQILDLRAEVAELRALLADRPADNEQ
jgi:transcriptional regulator with XRE-family HTH domain